MFQAQLLILLNRLDEASNYLDLASAGFKGTSDVGTPREVRLLLRRAELATARNDAATATTLHEQALDLLLSLGDNASDSLAETLFSYTQRLPAAELAKKTLARVEPLPLVKSLRAGETLSTDESIQLHTALGRLEQASGDLPAARKDLEQALALRKKFDDPASPWLAQLHGMLAEFYLQSGALPQARAALAQAEGAKAAAPLPWFSRPLATLHARLAANVAAR